MESVTCNACGSAAEAKTSKAGKVFFICPKCPGSGDHSNKFLTFLDDVADYKKKKVVTKKRKAATVVDRKEGDLTIEKRRKIEESNALSGIDSKIDDLIKRVDQVLFKVEQILDSIPRHQSDDEEEDLNE